LPRSVRRRTVTREPETGRLQEEPAVHGRGQRPTQRVAPPARERIGPPTLDLLHERSVCDEVAMVDDAERSRLASNERPREPHPQLRTMLGPEEAVRRPRLVEHRVDLQLLVQEERGPANAVAPCGHTDRSLR